VDLDIVSGRRGPLERGYQVPGQSDGDLVEDSRGGVRKRKLDRGYDLWYSLV
jgi:hypothetical protein